MHAKRKTVWLRVPDHTVLHGLLEHLETPLLTSTLRLPDDELPMTDALEVRDRLQRQIDLVIDAGPVGVEPTTVVDLTSGMPELVRQGLGHFE